MGHVYLWTLDDVRIKDLAGWRIRELLQAGNVDPEAAATVRAVAAGVAGLEW